MDNEVNEIWKDLLQKIKQLEEITKKKFIIQIKHLNEKGHEEINLVYPSDDSIPRKRLNLPLADTSESHGVRRMRAENRKLLKRIIE